MIWYVFSAVMPNPPCHTTSKMTGLWQTDLSWVATLHPLGVQKTAFRRLRPAEHVKDYDMLRNLSRCIGMSEDMSHIDCESQCASLAAAVCEPQ